MSLDPQNSGKAGCKSVHAYSPGTHVWRSYMKTGEYPEDLRPTTRAKRVGNNNRPCAKQGGSQGWTLKVVFKPLHVHPSICVHTFKCTHMYACAHTHTRAHTHTHTALKCILQGDKHLHFVELFIWKVCELCDSQGPRHRLKWRRHSF